MGYIGERTWLAPEQNGRWYWQHAALSVSTIINGERAGARKCRIVRVHSPPRGFTVIIKAD